MMYGNLAIMAVFVFLYSIASGGLERTPIKGALVFTAVGLALGPLGLGVLNLNVDKEGLRTLAELTLALILFTDAANADLSVLKRSFHIPQRLLFGSLATRHKQRLLLAAEGTGDTLAMITWVAFGAGVIGQAVGSFSWDVVLYALLSLTIVRMLPVFLALSGMGLRVDEKLFMGWFGPRGLASIVFAVIVLNEHLPNGGIIIMTVVCTIALSVVAHGLSANPLVAALTVRIKEGR